ncbi:MAG: response regulator transcription factor [Oscillospiraceae bacterium]|nr:response regulator transcription factor [Oscillospiraceae bacterium]
MENLRIGICDDESMDLAQIMDLVKLYDHENQFMVTTFLHASDLLDAATKLVFDIVLLDIEMEPPNGYEIAKKLIELPAPPVVIFATKSNAYALKGYGIAVRYLQKPVTRDAFYEAMDAAIADAIAHRLTFQIDNMLVSIRLRDVQYIETFGHYTVVHTDQESYRFRSTLKEMMAKLPKGYFVSPHKSYIVNLEHIRSASASEISMNCGVKIPIGRKRMSDFNEALYRFLGR